MHVLLRVDGMLADRYVFLTKRTEAVGGPIRDLGLLPCDAVCFANEIEDTQQKLLGIFEQYREPSREAGCPLTLEPSNPRTLEPSCFTVPPVNDAGEHFEGPQTRVALAAADFICETWTAWLSTEAGRVDRPYISVRRLVSSFWSVSLVRRQSLQAVRGLIPTARNRVGVTTGGARHDVRRGDRGSSMPRGARPDPQLYDRLSAQMARDTPAALWCRGRR